MRPTRLTPAVQGTILGALMQEHTFEAACALAGVARSTVYEWVARGRGQGARPSAAVYVDFANALEHAGFADAQNNAETTEPVPTDLGSAAFADEPFCEFRDAVARADSPPANSSVSPARSEFADSPDGAKPDMESKRARAPARENEAVSAVPAAAHAREAKHPERAWGSKRTREARSILEMEF